jgi:hypothetical protein
VRGVYGRRLPKRAPALMLGDYLTGKLPDVPVAADYIGQGGWEMLGNDRVGCCNAVTWANERRLISGALGSAEVYPSQDQVWAFYKTQNPGFDPGGSPDTNGPGSSQDQGMEVQTGLERLVKVGGPDDVKALGFTKVDHTNPAEVQAAVAVFGCVWAGAELTVVNEQEFDARKSWSEAPTSQVVGGHAFLTGGYGGSGTGPLAGKYRLITWAEEWSFTEQFLSTRVEEMWAVIWPEHIKGKFFLAGMDMPKFAADYQAITGRPFPAVIPSPAPSPPPGKYIADDLDRALADQLDPWAASHHVGANERAVKAYMNWRAGKTGL